MGEWQRKVKSVEREGMGTAKEGCTRWKERVEEVAMIGKER